MLATSLGQGRTANKAVAPTDRRLFAGDGEPALTSSQGP